MVVELNDSVVVDVVVVNTTGKLFFVVVVVVEVDDAAVDVDRLTSVWTVGAGVETRASCSNSRSLLSLKRTGTDSTSLSRLLSRSMLGRALNCFRASLSLSLLL